MKRLKADLHIHTALSPCSMEEMSPPAIVREAINKGLAMIAICDHNSAGNTAAVQKAAGGHIAVIAGMEITTEEEVHVVGLFPDADAACSAAEIVRATLPEAGEGSSKFGPQLLMDSEGRVVGKEPKMLAVAAGFNLSESVKLIKEHNGIAVAAHINRPSFSVISQLGLFPTDAGFDAIEIFSSALRPVPMNKEFYSYGLPVFSSSDSHFLSDIGICFSVLEIFEPTFAELALAVKGIGGRKIVNA